MKENDFIHKEFPKKFSRDDFWSQIKRSVNGKPVPESDICMIVDQIKLHMQFSKEDHLLDVGCGNGALASRFFDCVARYTGVDFSAYLLEIANEYFKPDNRVQYIEDDARSFSTTYTETSGINKLLVYGCASYFSREEFVLFLKNISERFSGINTIFIGNIPDIEKAPEFYSRRDITDYDVDDNQSPIGVWWDQNFLIKKGEELGFVASCVKMPETFYGHHYRFDLVLKRF